MKNLILKLIGLGTYIVAAFFYIWAIIFAIETLWLFFYRLNLFVQHVGMNIDKALSDLAFSTSIYLLASFLAAMLGYFFHLVGQNIAEKIEEPSNKKGEKKND